MAPQYTSTLHFLTRHSLSGRSVCVAGLSKRRGLVEERFVSYTREERALKQLDLLVLVALETTHETLGACKLRSVACVKGWRGFFPLKEKFYQW